MSDLMSDFVIPCNFQDICSGYLFLHLCKIVLVVLPPTGKHLLRYK